MACAQYPSRTQAVAGFSGRGADGAYKTQADCLQACKEGACCEDTTCTVKPQCQCQGTGQVFKGVGTTCASLNVACCEDGPVGSPPTCSIKTSCECVGAGKKIVGAGASCENVNCCRSCLLFNCLSPACIPQYVTATYSVTFPGQWLHEVSSYIDAFTISGTVTLSLVTLNPHPCGRYVFQSATTAGPYLSVTGEAGGSYITVRRGFQRVEFRDYDNGAGGVVQHWWGTTSPTASASGEMATLGLESYGNAFLGGESSGYCYRGGSTNLLVDYLPSERSFRTVLNPNPVPAVTNSPCGIITAINAYGNGA